MLHRSFQRPAITAQMLILQTLSNYVKILHHIKQTLTHAFPSPTQYKQKADAAENRNRTSESEESHSYAMIKYCLQTFIYQKSICNSETTVKNLPQTRN